MPLAAPPEAVLPVTQEVPVEGIEGAEVGRNGVVIVEAVQHQPQVAPLLRDRQVPHPAQVGLDLPELSVQPLAYGVPPNQPPTLPGPPEDVGEAQEGEGFRLALTSGLAVLTASEFEGRNACSQI